MAKRRIRIIYTCSCFVRHEHRWKATAWLCGHWQYLQARAWCKAQRIAKDQGYHL